MARYARETSVSVARSRSEIEATLLRYGADSFASGFDRKQAAIQFQYERCVIKFLLPLPDRHSEEFTRTPARRARRRPEDAERAWEQACRQRWRALALVIKAKLEAVDAGISTFEEEFFAWTVLPGGATVGQQLLPQIDHAIETGKAPVLQITEGA